MIAFEENGKIYLAVILDDSLLPKNYISVETAPIEPDETWYIEDGQIKIDQQKLIEFNRKNMPNLNKRDFRKKLRDAKLFDLADNYVKNSGDGYLQDAWDYSDYYSRTDPILIQALSDLGITPEKADEIWTA